MSPLQYPLPHGRLLAPITDGVGNRAPWGQVEPDGPDEIPKEVMDPRHHPYPPTIFLPDRNLPSLQGIVVGRPAVGSPRFL